MQEHMKKKKVEIGKYMEEKGITLEEYKVHFIRIIMIIICYVCYISHLKKKSFLLVNVIKRV